MKPKVLVLALLTAATALPASARAADDFCSRIFIYAINQICHLLPNGQTLCQPVALAGPGPSCESPSAPQLVQIPFGPPTIQMSPYSPFAPTANPAVPNPYVPNPFAANPFAANAYPPFPFAPNLFGPNTYAPKAYAPAALPPVVAAPVKPVAVIEPAPAVPAEKPLAKLMPATAPTGGAAAVASAAPPVPAAQTAPKTPEPVKAAAAAASPVAAPAPEPKATQAPAAAAPLAALPTPVVTPTARPDAAPAVAIAAPIAVTAVPAVDPKAAAQAEIARVQAEKTIEDALAHFEFDSAELTSVGRAMLDTWLAQAPGDARIVVTGHADRLGPEPYNEKLSLLRAEAVKKYLTEKGKPANRIQLLAKGEAMPVISCAGDATPTTKACLAPNRRAEIVIKPVAQPAAKTATKPVAKSISKRVAKPIAKAIKPKPAR